MKTNCTIHRIVIYPVDSAIHLLNNWGQVNHYQVVKYYAGLLIGCGKKIQFHGIFRDRFAEQSAYFADILGANFAGKQSDKNG